MTEFEKKVLREVIKIPLGETRTYKEIAQSIGKPSSFRAVAKVLKNNPYPFFIPCHRVIYSHKKGFGGYSLGRELKKKLLELEEKIREELER
ncbi:MAG: hypothetical protein DRP76_04275 [Candidatus Omnitrophota bacterium]|nr:MAG: hypothetical protein DRP76_04275 [Candidatus Omnitrophota bacterium]